MKLKKVCLLLFVVLLLLLLKEITCIANYNQGENLIGEEDRRAADPYEQFKEASKRGLYDSSGTHTRHQTYSSGYGELGTFSSPGFGYLPPSATHYQPASTYGHIYPTYNSGHESFGHSGHGISYGHDDGSHHNSHGALALKGLLIPLAGIALLGAAAALSTNPVLLQLGVVNGRKRRRRSFSVNAYPASPVVRPHRK